MAPGACRFPTQARDFYNDITTIRSGFLLSLLDVKYKFYKFLQILYDDDDDKIYSM